MSRGPRLAPLDVDARIVRLHGQLEEHGVAARMPPGQLDQELADVRAHLQRPAPPGVEERVVVKDHWWHRVEQVTIRSGPSPTMSFAPIRDDEGRIDVELTMVHRRLVQEAMRPEIVGSMTIRQRAVMWLLRRYLRRKGRIPAEPIDLEAWHRATWERLRERDEGGGESGGEAGGGPG